MQEVFVGTDRLPARHVTALGGCIIGLIAGVALAGAAGWLVLESERADARKQAANIRAEADHAIAQVKADAAKSQMRLSAMPIAYVAGISSRNSDELTTMMAKFPAFKTDPYKQLFAELGSLVQKQRDQSTALVTKLEDGSVSAPNVCSVTGGAAPGPILWSSGSSSLSADGWRGVAP